MDKMCCVDRLECRMLKYYTLKDPSQIVHTLCVREYTRLLARQEGYAAHQVSLLEIAALLHDIGCPQSKEKYGNSLPFNQEREGAVIAAEWLQQEVGLESSEREWVVAVVGSHHQFKRSRELGFQVLFEADMIVNIQEGYYDRSQLWHYYDKMITTLSGQRLYRLLFGDPPK